MGLATLLNAATQTREPAVVLLARTAPLDDARPSLQSHDPASCPGQPEHPAGDAGAVLVSTLDDTTITTSRLTLTALRPEDADEMIEVLSGDRLHEFIGGRPGNRDEVRDRYRRLAAGSCNPKEVWLNWIVRRRLDSRLVGTVQATVVDRDSTCEAYVAWIVGVPWQNRGIASEAATALVDWLRDRGVVVINAHIHPDHAASARVAGRAGLEPTGEQIDGEQVWRSCQRS
jgi:RimJ/RimL family protein N-acetyltransferase